MKKRRRKREDRRKITYVQREKKEKVDSRDTKKKKNKEKEKIEKKIIKKGRDNHIKNAAIETRKLRGNKTQDQSLQVEGKYPKAGYPFRRRARDPINHFLVCLIPYFIPNQDRCKRRTYQLATRQISIPLPPPLNIMYILCVSVLLVQ